MSSESPLQRDSRIDEEVLVAAISRSVEVAVELTLCTDGKREILQATQRVEVEPQLWLTREYQLAMAISLYATPEVKESGECESLVTECCAPNACHLERGISLRAKLSLEVLLVHHLE